MNADSSPYSLDVGWVRRSFDRASTTYDTAAVLQTEVREALLRRLELTKLEPSLVLDVGAATGHASRALKRRYPEALVVAVDSALCMLRVAARQRAWFKPFARVCADAERLPFKDGSVDLIVSNLMLPWSTPDPVFSEFRRVLAPRGSLSFSTLGPDTLQELRHSWAQVDSHTRVNHFIDMHDLGDAMVRAGFAAPVLDIERYTLTYGDLSGLTADLKALGARNATHGRPRGLTTPRKFAALRRAYDIHRRDGRLPATYEVVYGQAWAPADTPRRLVGDSVNLPLQEVRRQLQRHGPSTRAP